MQTSAGWMCDTPTLACLAGMGRTEALRKLRSDRGALAAMYASDQYPAAQRWADRWAQNDYVYEQALLRGFAAQGDVQRGVVSLTQVERWALDLRGPGRHPDSVGLQWDVASYELSRHHARPIRGADTGPASFAGEWIEGWLGDLERHILADPPTDAARACVHEAGVGLLTWLGNHLAEMPDGVEGSEQALRSVHRAWPRIAPGGVSRVQVDSVRRLWLGTCSNGYQNDRSVRCVGIVPWIMRGHKIDQARRAPAMATSWAVAIDQADPVVARLSRDDLRRRQKGIRRRTSRLLTIEVQCQPRVEVVRPQRRQSAAA